VKRIDPRPQRSLQIQIFEPAIEQVRRRIGSNFSFPCGDPHTNHLHSASARLARSMKRRKRTGTGTTHAATMSLETAVLVLALFVVAARLLWLST
jgi:hypothetical protein